MLKRLLAPFLTVMALTGAAFTAPAHAQVSADAAQTPDGLVKAVVSDVMNTVKSDKDMQSGNIGKITQLVEQKILPHANFEKTTQIAMGRNWSKASPEQQKAITEQFKTLLIRTYAGAIAQIRDQAVQYRPYRGNADDTDATIRTQVINKGEPIQMDYRLEKTPEGWKVYDINVLGAWLTEAYKGSFNTIVTQQGIDGVIKTLQDRNKQLANAK
ncbi:MlaC/ttg2D family ABC transporter substrate-binding protein [Cupriavidus plantarum]|uniref:Phospholipid transport system substrate-binding protein n=1 Tax=Cupriavidus plantarum TaxID=942865 RepID=A0A316ELY5_9BURK|nr:ABC transporter substrate-binding protein [Cupriavidus plantarum]NYI02980.1 phospholipid transport system substrate-binding protein [Cupriavidus plantarum]PWK32293.1 phospholipid transport system substrate-binding protein [Cupriavidus plantarum]REE87279.1 phospholipid transport system substrate-binding protein [Cupriavidus plantarum]RLK29659.1 phospholipid transport system substrate-binding protein [Cupriavidus plantarum]CAG2154042.1 Intermembrane phospholipid transport system binding prote